MTTREINLCVSPVVTALATNRKLAEVARGLHRAAERLWTRVTDGDSYDMAPADIDNLKRLTTDVSRAITKLKLKSSRK